jgi:hypothetical protein
VAQGLERLRSKCRALGFSPFVWWGWVIKILRTLLGLKSYLGGRDQEDRGTKPIQANNSRDPISKKLNTKKGRWSGTRRRP